MASHCGIQCGKRVNVCFDCERMYCLNCGRPIFKRLQSKHVVVSVKRQTQPALQSYAKYGGVIAHAVIDKNKCGK